MTESSPAESRTRRTEASRAHARRVSVHLRRATAADVGMIADLAARTFRETFSDHNTEADMESYVALSFSTEQVGSEVDNPTNTFLLAFTDLAQPPVGFVKLARGSVDPAVRGAEPIELARLYVERSLRGRGVGTALMKECFVKAAREGRKTLWLGVWEHNPRAIAFYERWGFEQVGTHSFRLGSDGQTDLVMERTVEASPITSRGAKRESQSGKATGERHDG